MSKLGVIGAVVPLVSRDISLQSVELNITSCDHWITCASGSRECICKIGQKCYKMGIVALSKIKHAIATNQNGFDYSSVSSLEALNSPKFIMEEAGKDGSSRQQVREKLSDNGMEWQVAELVEEDIGAAKQFLGSKTLWATPMSVTAVIYSHHRPEYFSIEPEPDGPF